MLINSTALFEDGKFVHCRTFTLDVSAQTRAQDALRASEAKFHTLADNMTQQAWMTDTKGSVNWFNRRFYEYTGATPEQVQGWGWKTVQHPDHADRVVDLFQRLWDAGEPWEDVFPLRARDGTFRWFLSRALPVRNAADHSIRWFGTNTDVTEQRLAEEELRNALRRKDEFLAALAHELRNPLAAVRHGLDLVKIARDDGTVIEQARLVMERQLAHLVRMVDDLLDISRFTLGKIELRKERIELTAIVSDACEAIASQIAAGGHQLTTRIPATPIAISGDRTRLVQVLANLLNNACKFTPDGGRISLVVELNRRA